MSLYDKVTELRGNMPRGEVLDAGTGRASTRWLLSLNADAQRYPIRYGERFINSQLDMCTGILNYFTDRGLAVAMQQHIADLRQRALALNNIERGLMYGHDYIVVAEPV
jgi:hypothetical protein